MKCPKCGSEQIHTWIVAICYICGYEGQRLEFANTEDCKKRELEFRKHIPELIAKMRSLKE